MKTVGELKELIKDIPDHVLIGSKGHFGELLECHLIERLWIYKDQNNRRKVEVLVFTIEDAGEEPD